MKNTWLQYGLEKESKNFLYTGKRYGGLLHTNDYAADNNFNGMHSSLTDWLYREKSVFMDKYYALELKVNNTIAHEIAKINSDPASAEQIAAHMQNKTVLLQGMADFVSYVGA